MQVVPGKFVCKFLAPTCVDMHAEYLVPCTKGSLGAIVGKDVLDQSNHRVQCEQSL